MKFDAEILIVGAGPVGLALAGDLGWRGRTSIVVERGTGEITQPKMDLVGIRTMEHCRRWGIVADVETSPYPRDYPQDNVYLTALTGYELGRERFPSMGADLPPPVSPQKRERCPQNMFDPILRRFSSSFPEVDIRYRTEALGFVDGIDGVSLTVADLETGRRSVLTGRYLIGCDGARSRIADALGISYSGAGTLTHTTNAIIRAPGLNRLHDKAPGYRYIFIGPTGTWGTLVAIDGRDNWRLSIIGSERERVSYDEAAVRKFAWRCMGKAFDLDVLSIVPWTRSELVADSYGKGHVFLAGDAAHVMSPTGGFGMNTGIGDAVDLSWKLAAVLDGWGGKTLERSYELERRPVAARNVAEASLNLKNMLSPGENPELLDATETGERVRAKVGKSFSDLMKNEWFTLHIHLGYSYAGSPIVAAEEDGAEAPAPGGYVQTTQPGARAPHHWIAPGQSTLDLFGRGFVLLSFADQSGECFAAAARRLGIPLVAHHFDDADLHAAYQRKLVLVRPDGHVAWRADHHPEDAGEVLRLVAGLARPLRAAGKSRAQSL